MDRVKARRGGGRVLQSCPKMNLKSLYKGKGEDSKAKVAGSGKKCAFPQKARTHTKRGTSVGERCGQQWLKALGIDPSLKPEGII